MAELSRQPLPAHTCEYISELCLYTRSSTAALPHPAAHLPESPHDSQALLTAPCRSLLQGPAPALVDWCAGRHHRLALVQVDMGLERGRGGHLRGGDALLSILPPALLRR